MANLLNPVQAFETLKERVVDAFKHHFPIEGQQNRLELVDISVEDSNSPESPYHIDNVKAQEDAKLSGGSWEVPVKGVLRLIHKGDGKVLDEARITLAKIPKLTNRFSYIVEGNERQHDGVFRLRSRPYHYTADNGVIKAQWNMAKGIGFDLFIKDRKTGFMLMKIGTSNVPIYSVLAALGVSDEEMRQAWGPSTFDVNKKKAKSTDLLKIMKIIRKPKKGEADPTPATARTEVANYFQKQTKLRPDAMYSAFGIKDDHVNGQNLLMSTTRILGISRGTVEEDDRQSLAAKDLTSTEDFVAEAITNKSRDIEKNIRDNIDRKSRVADIVSNYPYTKIIRQTFTNAQRPEQTNPLTFVSGYLRTTIRGADFGGIKGENVNLDKDQQINPSHLGFLDAIQTPEGTETGIALHLPLGVKKVDKELKTTVWDVKAGKSVDVTPAEMERAVVAYPDQVEWKNGKPVPLEEIVTVYDSDRSTTRRPWKDVQYVLPSAKATLSFSANLVPFLQNNNGNRAMMAAKQQEQAVSLKYREAPLVQAKTDGALTFDELLGTVSSHRSPVDGTVESVSADEIVIKGSDGKRVTVSIYNHFPLNGGKTMINAEPTVKKGDVVKKHQLIADTNYTKNGRLALGTNIRVAYIPYEGRNFEDGIVVSESAAKKLTSSHLHEESIFLYEGMQVNRARWKDYTIPERVSSERLGKLDENGIVKVGQKVYNGDVLVAAIAPQKTLSQDQLDMAAIRKSLVRGFRDAALVWEHDHEGTVAKVVRGRDKISVFVRTDEPLVVGDKLSGRHGNKGIVSKIIPDHDMPHDKEGNPVQIMLNVAGVPSRMNVGQALETAASKIAKKTGQTYVTENFLPGVDYTQKVQGDLKKHGLTDTEELIDPKTGRSLGQVMVGDQYVIKLHQQVEKKMTARSYGDRYSSVSGAAPRGSGIPGGGQKIDQLTTYSLLAHGAVHNLREAQTYKSDSDQEDVWDALITGRSLPAAQPSKALGNFLSYVKAMGVHVDKQGDAYVLSPMTDKQTLAISNGEIKMPSKTLAARGLRTIEEAGGLFDPKITGARFTDNGVEGKYWSHINLATRVPNPMFETPITMILGMKETEFDELVGPKLINGRSGFDILNERLAAVDVDKELAATEASLPKLKDAALARAYRKVRYLRALKKLKISPLDAYTNKVVPVIPPALRQVKLDPTGKLTFDDLNALYRVVGQANEQLKTMDKATPPETVQKTRSFLYDAMRGLRVSGMDLGTTNRHHQGLMEKMKGLNPKSSFFQDFVIGRRQDLSGRSTIIPEPDMGLDEIGLPVPVAMEMYKPFVIRELSTSLGVTPARAWQLFKQKDPTARRALDRVIQRRPVMAKRDPALHRFSIMAFRPRLIPGKAVAIHPLITGGFNADFDGDTMGLYVPVHHTAVDEAHRLLPSQNLFSPTHGGLMNIPSQDSLLGLFQATAWGKEIGKTLTREDAIRLAKAGTIKATDVVTVGGKKTTGGRLWLASCLPLQMQNDDRLLHTPTFRLDKKGLKDMLTKVAKDYQKDFAQTVNDWKDIGNKLSFLHGSSFSLNDFHDGKELRDEILAPFKKQEAAIYANSKLSKKDKDAQIINLYEHASTLLKQRGEARYNQGNNRIYEWKASGGRGNWEQFSQLVMGAMLVKDPANEYVPVPITKSFGEGLPFSQYWASLHGARKGTLDRASGTAEPGALTKEIINTMIDHKISMDDCGTTQGVAMDPKNADALGRFLAPDTTLKNGEVLRAGTLIDSAVRSKLVNAGMDKVIVRSPLRCKAASGVCAKCFGLNENDKLHPIGTNIGVIAGHALGEPVIQLTMRTFHTGGVGGGGVVDAFARVKQLFSVPKKLKGQATLSTVDGTITRIATNTEQGGRDVFVRDAKNVEKGFFVPAELQLLPTVTVGMTVKRGDPLSTGPRNPNEILKLTGNMNAVRSYLVDETDEAYGGLTKRRNIEAVVRAATNLAQVEAAPGHPEYTRGQRVPLNELEDVNRRAAAAGQPLVIYTPILKPMQQMPTEGREDWMGRLNFQRLERTFEEGAAQGWSSDIHGSTIAGLAHGAQFGLPKAPVPFTPQAFAARPSR